MKKNIIILAATCVLFLTACNDYQDQLDQAPVLSGNAQAGQDVYTQSGCASCHGADGKQEAFGISRIISDIATVVDIQNSLLAMRTPESTRDSVMKGIASGMSQQDIIDVSFYINTLK